MKIDFWTSTEYSGFMVGLMRELNLLGFDASQRFLITESSYRSARSGFARIYLRFRQYVAYPIQVIFVLIWQKLNGKRRDCIVVSTNTFYVPLLATFFHSQVVHLVYDLFPEAMVHSGKLDSESLKAKFIRWIAGKTLKRARLNIFLGERLKSYVDSIHGDCGEYYIIPVGADHELFPEQIVFGDPSRSANPNESVSNRVPQVLYCGNFGNMHESQTLFDFFSYVASKFNTEGAINGPAQETDNTLPDTFPKFLFHCSGPKRGELEMQLKLYPEAVSSMVKLGGGLGQDEWIHILVNCDIALVTMVPGAERVVMPSKTYSAMMAGQAILAIAPEDSDLVDTIKLSNSGWWIEPSDVGRLKKTLKDIRLDPELLMQKRANAYKYAHENFGQDALALLWRDCFSSLKLVS
ncbi:MAG: hypothetical protein AAGH40_03140 [Verrucomicrobiota bacterium]